MAASNGPGVTANQPAGGEGCPCTSGPRRGSAPCPQPACRVPALDTRWQRGLYQSLASTGMVCTEPLPRPTFSFSSTQGLFTHQWARAHLRHLRLAQLPARRRDTHLQASTVTLALQVNSGNLISPSEFHQDCVYEVSSGYNLTGFHLIPTSNSFHGF